MKLLSKGITNAKTAKNELETFIMYLSPYTQNSFGINVCPNASAECAKLCLNTAGLGKFTNVQNARIAKTDFYIKDRKNFLGQLFKELTLINKKAIKESKNIAIRLNGTSDLDFIGQLNKQFNTNILTLFSNLVFYDYTKILGKVKKYQGQKYYLTFSRSEITKDTEIVEALNLGANVSFVFAKNLPNNLTINGKTFNVLDGDISDLVMINNNSKILGLKAKGKAKNSNSNFVLNV